MTIPYFLPPVLFTRVDSCQEGLFRTNTSKEGAAGDGNSTIIGLTRNRRFKHATYIPFSLADPIPDKAHPQALRMLKFKLVTNEQFNLVKEVTFHLKCLFLFRNGYRKFIYFMAIASGTTTDLAAQRAHVRNKDAETKTENYSAGIGVLLYNRTVASDVGPVWL